MNILVVAATHFEIEKFSQCSSCDFLVTGAGVPATIFHLQKHLFSHDYGLVINSGIAGTFNADFDERGKLFVVNKDCFADVGINENGKLTSVREAGFQNENDEIFYGDFILNETPWNDATRLPITQACTVNKVTDDATTIQQIAEKYHPHLESMEGAGFFYVCRQMKVPCIQVRAVSNVVGVRDKAQWKMKESIAALNDFLIEFSERIKHD